MTAENRRLTRVERAVLAVLVDPRFNQPNTTNAERIAAADVSERRFYEVMADPWFQDQQRRAFLDVIRTNIGPIVEAAVKTASAEGRDGHQDRKMLLEMGGMYIPKSAIDHTTGGLPMKAFADIDDGEPVALSPDVDPATE
nr:hypothetical protein [uncultured Rhodopila sp.]